jgi:hypothetical protein
MISRLNQTAIFANYSEGWKFVEQWRKNPGFIRHDSGVREFPALVIYSWKTRSITETTTVQLRIVGYGEEYQIDIAETNNLSVEEFHLKLKADFQVYSYNEDRHSLIVTGDSQKMGGKYKIEIIPSLSRRWSSD